MDSRELFLLGLKTNLKEFLQSSAKNHQLAQVLPVWSHKCLNVLESGQDLPLKFKRAMSCPGMSLSPWRLRCVRCSGASELIRLCLFLYPPPNIPKVLVDVLLKHCMFPRAVALECLCCSPDLGFGCSRAMKGEQDLVLGLSLPLLPALGAVQPDGLGIFCAPSGKADSFLGAGGNRQDLSVSPPARGLQLFIGSGCPWADGRRQQMPVVAQGLSWYPGLTFKPCLRPRLVSLVPQSRVCLVRRGFIFSQQRV